MPEFMYIYHVHAGDCGGQEQMSESGTSVTDSCSLFHESTENITQALFKSSKCFNTKPPFQLPFAEFKLFNLPLEPL